MPILLQQRMNGFAGKPVHEICILASELNRHKKAAGNPAAKKNELCNVLVFNDFLVEFDTSIAVNGSDKVYSFL